VRLFVATWPPAPLVEQLQSIERPSLPGVRWTTAEQWHVTLRFLGDVADAGPVIAALETADLPAAFVAEVGPETGTFRGEVLHVPVGGLAPLAAAVIGATASFGRPPEKRPFRGHLTLARSRRGDLRPLAGAPVRGSWPVDEVTVVETRLSPKGSSYSVIGRVALPR
jgi:RNA 2',3'-cyclic 3'-phosphodiesterase